MSQKDKVIGIPYYLNNIRIDPLLRTESKPEDQFQPGQVVKYVGLTETLEGLWKVIEYVRPSEIFSDRHVWLCESIGGTLCVKYQFFDNELSTDTTIEQKCVCKIQDLMTCGCKCGQMDRERNE